MRISHPRTLAILVAIGALTALMQASALAFGGFSDVRHDTYYAEAVAWAAEEGITQGTAPGCFSPDATMSRAQGVVMLWRAAGEPDADQRSAFSDVTAAWQTEAVAWAAEEGITTGTSPGRFSPDASVTRAQGVVFLWRYQGESRADDIAPDVLCAQSPRSGAPVSVGLNASTTGLRGAIAAGLWRGSVSDPYAGLVRYPSGLTIDDEWIEDRNGGSRVVEGIEVSGGSLDIETTGVTVRFCHIDSDSRYPVENQNGGSDFTMEWCEIDATKSSGSKAVIGSGFTLYRLDVEGGDDGIYLSRKPGGDVLIDEVYVHRQNKRPGAHADQIQDYHDGVVVIRNSKLIGFYKDSNAPLQINTPPSTGVRSQVTVTGNYMFGGVVFINGQGRSGSGYEGNYFAYDSSNSGCFANAGDVPVGTNYFWEWVDGISHQGDDIGKDGNYTLVPLPPQPSNMPPNGTPITTKSACNAEW